MIKDETSRFIYHAQGMALGGFLDRPMEEAIETQAAVSLPITGGYGTARSAHFRHRDLISFHSAHSHVSGRKSVDGSSFETLVTSVVEGLNILDVVTADRIVGRITASHPNEDNTEPCITPVGSHFVNLRVNGREPRFKWLANHFEECENYEGVTRRFAQNLESAGQGWREKDFFPVYLAQDLTLDDDDPEQGRNFLEIPHIGRIYLGELIVTRQTRRLTMLRVELGCPGKGSVCASSVEGDGHRIP